MKKKIADEAIFIMSLLTFIACGHYIDINSLGYVALSDIAVVGIMYSLYKKFKK